MATRKSMIKGVAKHPRARPAVKVSLKKVTLAPKSSSMAGKRRCRHKAIKSLLSK